MTALAQDKARRTATWKFKQFTLTSGKVAYKGARCCLDLNTGKVVPAAAGIGLMPIGVFAEAVDATSAAKLVNVDLEVEIQVEYFVNSGSTDAVAAADLGKLCYLYDDQTVGIQAKGHAIAGRVWDVDSTYGVGVQKVFITNTLQVGADAELGAFASNDLAPAATALVSGCVYDVPTTGANSTISLPTAMPDGTILYFTADGTKNGHTVTYRDVTTAISAAATASKRHLAICVMRGGKWFCSLVVGP